MGHLNPGYIGRDEMSGKIPLTIEWRHLEAGGITCDRCVDTGANLGRVIAQLRHEGFFDEFDLTLTETILPPERIDESNTLLVNGMPVEKILDADVTFTECSSCSDLIGEPACCRAVATDRDMYEALPEEMLRTAILKVVKQNYRA